MATTADTTSSALKTIQNGKFQVMTNLDVLHHVEDLKRKAEKNLPKELPIGFAYYILDVHDFSPAMVVRNFNRSTDLNKFLEKINLGKQSYKAKPREDCPICGINAVMFGLECDHNACTGCWENYFASKIQSGHHTMVCHACDQVVSDLCVDIWIQTDNTLTGRWSTLQMENFLKKNSRVRRCANQECDKIYKRVGESLDPIGLECPCGATFCFLCSLEPHEILDCSHWKDWLLTCSYQVSMPADPLTALINPCPKCLTMIGRDDNQCSYVTCRRCLYYSCIICGDRPDKHTHGARGYLHCQKVLAAATNRKFEANGLALYERAMLEDVCIMRLLTIADPITSSSLLLGLEGYEVLKKIIRQLALARHALINGFAFMHYLRTPFEYRAMENMVNELKADIDEKTTMVENLHNVTLSDVQALAEQIMGLDRHKEAFFTNTKQTRWSVRDI